MNKYLRQLLLTIAGIYLILMGSFISPAFAQVSYTPPTQSASVLQDIPFNQAVPVDEAYRKEFENCDKKGTFFGLSVPNNRSCQGDPNKVKAILKFPDGTIFYESKMSLDRDGSWIACKGDKSLNDLCSTSFPWPNINKIPDKYVDSDNIPYIVNPIVNFQRKVDRRFQNKTGTDLGDLGIVIYKDKIVPVFIADHGPYNKLGEGSARVHELIGEDKCKTGKRRTDGKTRPDVEKRWTSDTYCEDHKDVSVDDKVLFFIFPNSKISDLSPSNAVAKINAEALKRFENLKDNRQGVIQLNQPQSGQSFAVNTAVTFSGTANPEVSRIKVSIGPGGLFEIADLKNVKKNWTFEQVFNTKGSNRPVIIQPFDATDKPLKPLNFTITIQ
ncbi:MAG: hypothetical protein EWV76_14335 [Microcystis novacekii Mn_MB_F_20050700_S1]|uniref:Uncharacterized protein n=1 Tax=Microcystis novacekii Mn_MB_F_20050700_S1D TaxID=2486266 RepID=A0A552IGF7_9CHRO|nr:MAG: hypothetical protein EWV54_21590 [Microcystis novacekii Mn_MB_F_20050700_S1D]TRU85410.1 MAG: hypothetical protein EWV76_14335 [Microcystis novacekii Mn_MB_F_20050700_S1]